MRLNLYAEELTDEVELVKKVVDSGQTFYGIRFFLQSPDVLHYNSDDDDRSAVTFWVKWSKAGGTDPKVLISAFQQALNKLFSEVAQ